MLSVSMTLAAGAEDGLFDAGVGREQLVRVKMGRRLFAWLLVAGTFFVDITARVLSFSIAFYWFVHMGLWWVLLICLAVIYLIRVAIYYYFDNPPRDGRASFLIFGPTALFVDAPLLLRKRFLLSMHCCSVLEQILFLGLALWAIPAPACWGDCSAPSLAAFSPSSPASAAANSSA